MIIGHVFLVVLFDCDFLNDPKKIGKPFEIKIRDPKLKSSNYLVENTVDLLRIV